MKEKLRVISITTINNSVLYSVQRKPWWSIRWITLSYYYESEFTDMPGWFSEFFNSEQEARQALSQYKLTGSLLDSKTVKVVHEEI